MRRCSSHGSESNSRRALAKGRTGSNTAYSFVVCFSRLLLLSLMIRHFLCLLCCVLLLCHRATQDCHKNLLPTAGGPSRVLGDCPRVGVWGVIDMRVLLRR